MNRLTAGDRARRLLAIVPWVAARDGTAVSDICERFDIARTQLLNDLERLWFVGTPPYTPADLMEVDIVDDRVWIRYADTFERPLRLTPEQGLALVAAAESLLSIPGADADGPLARGLAKLAQALGVAGRVDIDLGAAPAALLSTLRSAVLDSQVIELDYWSFGRDERSRRHVEPHELVLDRGTWYLQAHCRVAGAERTFRVDRIHEALPTGERGSRRATGGRPAVGTFSDDDGKRVVVEIPAEARWVVEAHPCEVLEVLEDGRQRIALVVSTTGYLERLLLTLGPAARIIDGDAQVAARAARRILARYGVTS